MENWYVIASNTDSVVCTQKLDLQEFLIQESDTAVPVSDYGDLFLLMTVFGAVVLFFVHGMVLPR